MKTTTPATLKSSLKKSDVQERNTLKKSISKHSRHLRFTKKVSKTNEKIKKLAQKSGYFNPCNVRKREIRYRKEISTLRKLVSLLKSHKKANLHKTDLILAKIRTQNEGLFQEVSNFLFDGNGNQANPGSGLPC